MTARHVMPAPVDGVEWAVMRDVDRRSRTRATKALPLIRAAMTVTRASLLCIHVGASAPHVYEATAWRRERDGAYLIDEDHRPATIEEIGGHLTGAVRDIVARWPRLARPPVIGFATDGHMIAFNASHPACRGPGWIDEHLSGVSPCALVAHDGQHGLLALLSSRSGMQ